MNIQNYYRGQSEQNPLFLEAKIFSTLQGYLGKKEVKKNN